MIGRPLRRLEDPRLVRGEGRYVDDIQFPGMLHAVFVRSAEAHALIRDVSFQGPHEDVVGVFTAADLGLESPMPVQNPSPLIQQPITPSPLALDEVCFVGQPVAVVVAESQAKAVDAAGDVFVDYDVLPVVIDHRVALEPGAASAHSISASNLVGTIVAGYGDVDSAFNDAAHRIAIDVDEHRGAVASMEGRAVVGRWDDVEYRLTLWTSTQAPHAVRNLVAAYLGLSTDEMRVIAPDVGGGFGPKAVVYPEEYVISALAMRLARPVKWTERRREHFVATSQQRGQSGRIEAAVDETGKILGLQADLVHDGGAFASYGIAVPYSTVRLMSGPYVVPALAVRMDVVFTNAPPTGAIRGAGRPNAVFAVERLVDAIGRTLGLDREEVRRRNFIPPNAFPYQVDIPATDGRPTTYDGGDYSAAMEKALMAANVGKFDERRFDSARIGRLRGYGVASYVEDTGIGPYEGARLEVLSNGDVLVEIGAGSQGQGHATVFAQICSEHLGVDPEKVRVRGGDTARYAHGIATVASRTGVAAASAIHKTALELAGVIKQLAAERLETAPEDIVLVNGAAMVVGQPGTEIDLGDLAALLQPRLGSTTLPARQRPGLSVELVHPIEGIAYAYGTHFAEVEVDPETGQVSVVNYVVVHDCGTVLNAMIVDGQIDGGVAHGLGNAMTERVVFSDSGQPLTTSFMDYQVMAAADMPPLTKIHTETPSPLNPLGAKGAGEGGTLPAAAAVVSAIEHALVEFGVVVNHHPVSREWVFNAMRPGTVAL